MAHEVPVFFLIMIISGYVIIAGQFFIAARTTTEGEGKKAMLLLVGVFVLCAICGYLPGIIGLPESVKIAFHVALIIVTWWFIFTNQAARIMKALH